MNEKFTRTSCGPRSREELAEVLRHAIGVGRSPEDIADEVLFWLRDSRESVGLE